MDVLKSLTDQTETVFVLVGTYEMLGMINQNGQQGRRSRDIHMRRYQSRGVSKGADWGAYCNILNTLQVHLPLQEQPNLVKLAPYLYKGSLGCVGILMTWLYDTLDAVLRAGKVTILRQDLAACRREGISLWHGRSAG
jgi:hypothetical protein